MANYGILIEPAELLTLLEQHWERVVVCDCSFDLADPTAGLRTYEAGHIPGAVHLDLETALSGPKTGSNGRHPLPSPEAAVETMRSIGIEPDTQVIAYDSGDSMFAARLWWIMRWLGHQDVAVLNGGLKAWKRSEYPLESARPQTRSRGKFSAGKSLVTTIDYRTLRNSLSQPDQIVVDARAPDRFRGENETLDRTGGHIPGAVNHFFRTNLDGNGQFKPAGELRDAFTTLLKGVAAERVIHQCGSGVTACHNLLAMEVAGLSGATLYPGSWSEWSSQPDAKIATG